MEGCLGLLRIHVKRGINLAVRDGTSSDPYCVVTMAHQDRVMARIREEVMVSDFRCFKAVKWCFCSVSLLAYVSILCKCLQKVKTGVVKDNCNPEWNEALTLPIQNLNDPIILTVYDKDTFTKDDAMGNAEIDIKPYVEAIRMAKDIESLPMGCALKKVQPSMSNCLAEESSIVWNDGKITQEMLLKLRKVECGEVLVGLEWIDVPGCVGL